MPKVCVKKGKKWRLTGSGRMEKSRWKKVDGKRKWEAGKRVVHNYRNI